jgi:hypothetical protein
MSRLKKYYHVTFKSRISKILYEGIRIGRKRIWQSMYGSKLGKPNSIYAFDNWSAAVRWAYKQAYDMNKETVIVEFKEYEEVMNCYVTIHGEECIKRGSIYPEQITDIYDVDSKKFMH